jgi:glycosyltransferase involved in cell wall biosynthesis
MNKPCKVSVVIPCFNHGEFVQEAVDSVIKAKRDDMEILVVDDGSTDEHTHKEIDALSTRGIKVIRQENMGVGPARNTAILASQGDYIFPLDADDRLRPAGIDHGIRKLDSDPKVGVVYGDVEFFGTLTGRWKVGALDVGRMMEWNYLPVSALFRRSIWEQNQGYDGTMPVQGLEDWDFWLGALEHGWQFAYVPEVFFDYRKASESMLTRTSGFEPAIKEFVAKKHGALYQQAWLSVLRERDLLATERKSVKRTFHNLRRLLKARIKQKFATGAAALRREHANR